MFIIETIYRGRCFYIEEKTNSYRWVADKHLASSWYTKTLATKVKSYHELSNLCEVVLDKGL